MTLHDAKSPTRRMAGFAAVLWVVALYLVCRPYRGVRHDAMLYFGQAQLHLTPEWMSKDLFFLHSSQDRYSAFSTLFAPVLQSLGMSTGEIVALLVLHAIFLVAAWRLTAGMSTPMRWTALVVAIVLPHHYASEKRFGYDEPFLTARTLSEPFVLLGLAAAARRRWRGAAGWMSVATLAHPLIALPGWLMGWRLLCERDRRANWLALLVLPVFALAAFGLRPFDGLLQRYDPLWLDMVDKANTFVFLRSWTLPDWQTVGFSAALLWLAGTDRESPLAGLWRAACVVLIGCDLVSYIGCDLLHDVLITQLQLWRAGWIAQLLSWIALAPVALRLWRLNSKGHLAAAVLVLASVMVSSTARTAWELVAVAVLSIWLAYSRFEIRRLLVVLGIAACALGMVGITWVEYTFNMNQLMVGAGSGMVAGTPNGVLGLLPGLILSLALIGLWPLVRPSIASVAVATLVGLVTLLVGAATWDQRDAWSTLIERSQGHPHPFDAFMPQQAQVYWPEQVLPAWALLGRASFYSQAQGASTLFSRDTAQEIFHRLEIVGPHLLQTSVCEDLVLKGKIHLPLSSCRATDVAMIDVCHPDKGRVGPDFLVLTTPLLAPPVARWRFPNPDGFRPIDYLLYDCKKLH